MNTRHTRLHSMGTWVSHSGGYINQERKRKLEVSEMDKINKIIAKLEELESQ